MLRHQLFEIYPNTSVAEDATDNEVKLSAEKQTKKKKNNLHGLCKKDVIVRWCLMLRLYSLFATRNFHCIIRSLLT